MDVLEQGEEVWFDYIIAREDWEILMKNEDSEFYLINQILLKLSGVEMQHKFETVQPLTIAADKIELYEYDSKNNKAGKQLSLLELKKDGIFHAEVPDILIRTYTQDEEGNDVPASMDVTVIDGYLTELEKQDKVTVTTDSNGEYILKGYEIKNWWNQVDDNDDNKTNYKAYDIIFHSSRAVKTLPVVVRGATSVTGQLIVNVLAENGNGKYKRIPDAKVTVGKLSETTGKKGVVTLTGVPTGNGIVKIEADGYYTLEDTVEVSEKTEKTYYLTKDDGLGHSYIKNVQCSLSSNSLGNITIVPEGCV